MFLHNGHSQLSILVGWRWLSNRVFIPFLTFTIEKASKCTFFHNSPPWAGSQFPVAHFCVVIFFNSNFVFSHHPFCSSSYFFLTPFCYALFFILSSFLLTAELPASLAETEREINKIRQGTFVVTFIVVFCLFIWLGLVWSSSKVLFRVFTVLFVSHF